MPGKAGQIVYIPDKKKKKKKKKKEMHTVRFVKLWPIK